MVSVCGQVALKQDVGYRHFCDVRVATLSEVHLEADISCGDVGALRVSTDRETLCAAMRLLGRVSTKTLYLSAGCQPPRLHYPRSVLISVQGCDHAAAHSICAA